ncbi:MAG TPA: hypothetical protein VLD84_09825 [Nitrososphaeraceae archaeon]|nr:hypothetical protein [Nitrososphaeraceae archaeon]
MMGENYCNDPRCKGNRNGERHPAHDGISFKTEEMDIKDELENIATVESYCNDGSCVRTRRGEKHPAHFSYPGRCEIKYLGGHKAYPRPTDTEMFFYDERIEIEDPHLVIPYSSINNLENLDEKKISAKRVIALGLVAFPLAIVGAMWKKNHIYTVIQYRDEIDDHTIIVDFDEYLESAQPLIYENMLKARKKVS